jgi:hypothetical protein
MQLYDSLRGRGSAPQPGIRHGLNGAGPTIGRR